MRRSFRIWQAPGPGLGWRWECTLCHPPSKGGRYGPGAWERIIRVSLPRHMRVRVYHHRYVARNRG